MKWIGIAGSRRLDDGHIENVVRRDVKEIFFQGNAIVSGGGLGVDFIAVDEALKHDSTGQRIKVIIPSNIETYHEYFNHRASSGIVTQEQIEQLFSQLEKVRSICSSCLIELEGDTVNRKTFHARNSEVVNASDELQAYKAYQSSGTQNAIDTAYRMGKPTKVHEAPAPA